MKSEPEATSFGAEIDPQEGTSENAGTRKHPMLSKGRTRQQSWDELPQAVRGITLQELWEFYNSNAEYLRDQQWRCHGCHRRFPQHSGPCPSCGHPEGKLQMPNLYEVNSNIIMPTCQEECISYVEYLARRREGTKQIPVKTFVSHWWGEEFTKFVLALDRYAHVRAREQTQFGTKTTLIIYVVAALLVDLVLAFWGPSFWNMLHESGPLVALVVPASITTFVPVAITILVHKVNYLLETPNPLAWSFWICALCNNQYAVEHAIGESGVLDSSFAVALQAPHCSEVATIFDASATIYRRIWCAFELFFAKVLMPRNFGKKMQVTLVNEFGVLSDGDASLQAVQVMASVIGTINTSEAQASVESDKQMIQRLMLEEQTTSEDLDSILRQTAQDSLQAAKLRRNVPLALFGLVPLASIFLIVGFRFTADHTIQLLQPSPDEDLGPELLLGLIMLAISFTIFGGVRCLLVGPRCRPRDVKALYFWRNTLKIAAAVNTPVFLLLMAWVVASVSDSRGIDGDMAHNFDIAMSHFEMMASLLRGAFGTIVGLVYLIIRNIRACERTRKFVEDFCVQLGYT